MEQLASNLIWTRSVEELKAKAEHNMKYIFISFCSFGPKGYSILL